LRYPHPTQKTDETLLDETAGGCYKLRVVSGGVFLVAISGLSPPTQPLLLLNHINLSASRTCQHGGRRFVFIAMRGFDLIPQKAVNPAEEKTKW
jgi:hypothetical protein